jgi:hypothetical protein
MKRQRKPITPEMIRKYFGPGARITGFAGRYTVRTANGGEVKISQTNIDPVYGGSDVYRAAVLLSDEAWGGGEVYGGSAEFKLAVLAHGEAEGVNLRVAERGWLSRAFVAALIVVIGSNVLDKSYHGPTISAVIALLVWLLMKRAAKRRAQRESEQLGFAFPRTGGDPRDASREDAERGSWL